MNRYQFYGEIFNRGMKGEIITVKKAIKDLLKVAMENRVSNVTMALAKKMSLVHFLETVMWRSLRPIRTLVVEP